MLNSDVILFYQTVKAGIQETRADYLEKQKRQPFPQELTPLEEKTDEELDKMSAFARFFYRARVRRIKRIRNQEMRRQRKPAMADKLDKGYNAGMARALAILDVVFEEYKKKEDLK